jgi:glycosyltransferase involved in cell wall biosynthesis
MKTEGHYASRQAHSVLMNRLTIIKRMDCAVPPVNQSLETSQYPIGVIIPTFNRSEVLLTCLRHLERQTMKDFEVIIVDDGSTDSTPQLLERYRRESPLQLHYVRQENAGRARARNAAIFALRAPICLMIGNDIFASPDLVLKHLELHRSRPELQIAGLGLTRWSESGQKVTRFMRWLDESGVQFAYNDLLRGVRPDWKHFYTSNLSLKTKLLQENPFDESFKRYGVEDLELGYRLEKKCNLEVVFLPDAVAHHFHPTYFRQACRRNYDIGYSMQMFHELWPDSVSPDRNSPLRLSVRNLMIRTRWVLPPLTRLADLVTKAWCPNPLMRGTLIYHGILGYHGASSSGPRSKPIERT